MTATMGRPIEAASDRRTAAVSVIVVSFDRKKKRGGAGE
jgi:hypothetical protein